MTLSGQTVGHLASVTSLEHGVGSISCPWRIVAGNGQTIRLTLLSFGGGKQRSGALDDSNHGHSNVEPCYDIGEVREVEGDVTGVKQTMSMCTGSGRERVVYTSIGSDVIVQLLSKDVLRSMAAFMIRYEGMTLMALHKFRCCYYYYYLAAFVALVFKTLSLKRWCV